MGGLMVEVAGVACPERVRGKASALACAESKGTRNQCCFLFSAPGFQLNLASPSRCQSRVWLTPDKLYWQSGRSPVSSFAAVVIAHALFRFLSDSNVVGIVGAENDVAVVHGEGAPRQARDIAPRQARDIAPRQARDTKIRCADFGGGGGS